MKGHLRPRGEGTWAIVLDLGKDSETGRRRQKWHSFKGTKREAEKEQIRLLAELQQGSYVEPTKDTLGKFLAAWLEDAAAHRLTKRSYERYSDVVKLYITPYMGSIQLSKLQPMQIQSCYAKLLRGGGAERQGLSPETVRGVHIILKSALKQAVRWGILARNPADAVDAPKTETPEITALDEEETMRLLSTAKSTSLYMPILLAITTGMRRGEILALRWKDVDLKNGVVSVRQSLEETREGLRVKEPKTKAGRRTIVLPTIAVDELKAHKADQAARQFREGRRQSDRGIVCDNGEGDYYRPVNLSMHFGRFIKRHEFPPVRFHDLRHGHASHLLRAGVQPKVVSERLGHAKIGITMDLYSHILPGMQEDAALKLDTALRKANSRTR